MHGKAAIAKFTNAVRPWHAPGDFPSQDLIAPLLQLSHFAVSVKYAFSFQSEEARRPLPAKLIIAQHETETVVHVGLKLLAFLLFARERLQLETNLHDDNIPFLPDLVQLDYEMRPALWVECGECTLAKLDKLAVKAPFAEIWIVKKSSTDAEALLYAMKREELRRGRYGVVALDPEGFAEVCAHIQPRNEITWFGADFAPESEMQFDFNELWYELPFKVMKF